MEHAHQILGVPANASFDDIKQAYRSLVKINHPDLASDASKANQALKNINQAYTALRGRFVERDDNQHVPASHDADSKISPRRPNPKSVFGETRARAAEALAQRNAEALYARQSMDWQGDSREVRRKVLAGQDDVTTARNAASRVENPEEKRAAEARALREMREARMAGKSAHVPTYKAHEEARQKQAEIDRMRREVGAKSVDTDHSDLYMSTASAFGARRASEIVTSDRQDAALESAIQHRMRATAKAHIEARRTGDNPPDIAAFHKAQKVSFEGRTMKVHLGTPGATGRNLVAIPEFSQKGAEIKAGKGVQFIDLAAQGDGKQTLSLNDPSTVVSNGQGMKVQFVFSDQKVNLRSNATKALAQSSR